jgi:asparagine synthase (glutamine-hydrolysing)
MGRWLRGSFWPVVEEFVLSARARHRGLFDPFAVRRLAAEHRAGTAEHGDRLWALINLEVWQRMFCDGEEPMQVMQPMARQVVGTPAPRVLVAGDPASAS